MGLSLIFVLASAFWLIVNMSLDANQTNKYFRYSPQLNSDHEYNSNLNQRIENFCGDLKQIKFTDSDFAKFSEDQTKLHNEWKERCPSEHRTSNFSFSISYGISLQQIELAQVSTSFKISAELQFKYKYVPL